MTRYLEELSLNAWPALQTVHLDGWVLRFAAGYTRRANSVNPLYPSTGNLAGHIRACEALYRDRGLRTVFKMTPAAQPPGLDEVLASRGYVEEAHTSVQTLDLAGLDEARPDGGQATLAEGFSDEWLKAVSALQKVSDHSRQMARQMLANLVLPACYATLPSAESDHAPVAAGLAVLQGDHVGFYDIITHPDQRRRGYARLLMLELLAWGQAHGAHTAYLQVMLNNLPALQLYAGLGFREAYQYWYRVKGD